MHLSRTDGSMVTAVRVIFQGGQSRDKNELLCTSIRTEPVNKSAICFFKPNAISRGKVHIPRNNTL